MINFFHVKRSAHESYSEVTFLTIELLGERQFLRQQAWANWRKTGQNDSDGGAGTAVLDGVGLSSAIVGRAVKKKEEASKKKKNKDKWFVWDVLL